MTLQRAINRAAAGDPGIGSLGIGAVGRPSSIIPLVSADFKNGVYSINGVSKTLEEVWEYNSDYAAFNPADVVNGVGYSPSPIGGYTGPTLTPTAYAALPAQGFVEVVTLAIAPGNAAEIYFYSDWIALPSYSDDWFTVLQAGPSIADRFVVSDYTAGTIDNYTISSGVHKTATRFTTSLLTGSADGRAAINYTPSGLNASRSAKGISLWATNASSAVCAVENIEIFSLSDYAAADLPALSAA